MAEKYFMLETKETETNIVIYGDITSWEWLESDVSSYSLAKAIEGITSETINVYINSYGGEVAEGVAIYRQLKRHSARVCTYCDGFACSAASVVFMAGDARIVYPTSMLMIHNALYDSVSGNAAELRKYANDIEAISQTAANAYMDAVTIDRETLDELLANETWLTPQMAVDMGFATLLAEEKTVSAKAALSARKSVFQMICAAQNVQNSIATPTACAFGPIAATAGILKTTYAASGEIVLDGVPYVVTMDSKAQTQPAKNRFLKLLEAAVDMQTCRENK